MKRNFLFKIFALFIFCLPNSAHAGMYMGSTKKLAVFLASLWFVSYFLPCLISFFISKRFKIVISTVFSVLCLVYSLVSTACIFILDYPNTKVIEENMKYFVILIWGHLIVLIAFLILRRINDKRAVKISDVSK